MKKRRWPKILLAVVVVVVALLALNTYLINQETKPAKATVGKIVDLPAGDDLQVRVDGLQPTPVPHAVEPPTLVLIHGWTSSIQWWDRITPLLAKHFRVVRIDLLGHGGSAKPGSGYSIPHQAELVSDVLDKLKIRRATVIGHSLGGSVSSQLALSRPDLVTKLILIDAPPATKYIDQSFLMKMSLAPVAGQLTKRLATDDAIKDGLQKAFTPDFKVPQVFVDQVKGMTFSGYKGSAEGLKNYVDEEGLASRLTEFKKPVLVIWGLKDDLVKSSSIEDFRHLPRTKIVTYPGVGHTPMVEVPAKTAKDIESFIDLSP